MMSAIFTPRAARWIYLVLGGCLLLILPLDRAYSQKGLKGKAIPKGLAPSVSGPVATPVPQVKLPVEPAGSSGSCLYRW
jgi:hypothetical protein